MPDKLVALPQLAERINAEHAAAETALRAGLTNARAAGELLLQAKAQCRHGAWLPWLSANVAVPERTAQAYMRVAKRWDKLQAKSATVADLTFKAALAALADRQTPLPEVDPEGERV